MRGEKRFPRETRSAPTALDQSGEKGVPKERVTKHSILCVGLDPHAAELGEGHANPEGAVNFCKRLISNTKHVAVCYKPNSAFFEQFGADGWAALEQVVGCIPDDIPIIFDAKRG